ncbi:MAG: sigma-54-dependent Fis family transcriptional regulator [Proteobacteria bacterium]|nr:sigma-54-dependent Fis family transcriptional regulator [Pseudomonadota bacterium]
MSTRTHHADVVFRVAARQALTTASSGTPGVDTSWRRCLREFNLDPERTYQPTVLDPSNLRARQAEHGDLIEIARAEMESLYQQISGSGYALLLADADGVILAETVDPTLQPMFRRAGLLAGADWSERREGTNGIGTCATESRPLTIHQTDHFRTSHIGLTCSAAPIHDPQGRVIAVLDASSVGSKSSRDSQVHTVALVNASARLIEKCLFLRRHSRDAVLRFHYRPEFVELLHDGAIAVAANGTIVAADLAGIGLLGAKHRAELIGRAIDDVFDTGFEELRDAAVSGRRAIWELRDRQSGNRYYARLGSTGEAGRRAPVTVTAPALVRIAPRGADAPLTLDSLTGDDPQMQRSVYAARRVADTGMSVLLSGPTGSGKEVLARAMHLASSRAHRAFIAVNCGAIPETLIESELFGYAPGAFTGARRQGLRGRLEQSSGGTLFLDEIGDMPLSLQTRLLRVLEEREVLPLAAETPIKVDLRVIAASHRNLREMVARGDFREDLFYRINGLTIELPPLAQRADLEALVRSCIALETPGDQPAAIERDALQRLLAYPWPGNIRELRNTLRGALVMGDGRTVRLGDLPPHLHDAREPGSPSRHAAPAAAPIASTSLLADAERGALIAAIQEAHGNMSRVASALGISRNTLYRKLKRHSISAHALRSE